MSENIDTSLAFFAYRVEKAFKDAARGDPSHPAISLVCKEISGLFSAARDAKKNIRIRVLDAVGGEPTLTYEDVPLHWLYRPYPKKYLKTIEHLEDAALFTLNEYCRILVSNVDSMNTTCSCGNVYKSIANANACRGSHAQGTTRGPFVRERAEVIATYWNCTKQIANTSITMYAPFVRSMESVGTEIQPVLDVVLGKHVDGISLAVALCYATEDTFLLVPRMGTYKSPVADFFDEIERIAMLAHRIVECVLPQAMTLKLLYEDDVEKEKQKKDKAKKQKKKEKKREKKQEKKTVEKNNPFAAFSRRGVRGEDEMPLKIPNVVELEEDLDHLLWYGVPFLQIKQYCPPPKPGTFDFVSHVRYMLKASMENL